MAKFFINRPIVAMVIAILMVIVGTVSMLSLPTAQFPNIVPPEIRVQSTFPGADAQTLEQSVATPLESTISGVDNMTYMYSINANNGQSVITVDFDVKTDPDIDQVLTQLRVSQAQSQLPAQVNTAGVVVQKSLSAPLMIISLYSPKGSYDSIFLANYAYINLVDELTRVPGISRVQIFGAGQYSMRIWVKPDQLAKLSITVPQIVQAIQTQNTVNPAGQIGGEPVPNGQEFTYTVRAQGRLTSPEEFGNIILRANPDGSNLRLKDVARIELGAQTYNLTGRFKGKPAAIMAVYQLPGSNAVAAAKPFASASPQLQTRFPHDLEYAVPLDTTKAVTAGMREIAYTLLEALALVVVVVYLFLQGWRATLIPLLAVPVSLIGTFAVFPLLGFSINTLSLFGLVLAIGLVVDDAIVVVEAVEHHIEQGMSPRDAALQRHGTSLEPGHRDRADSCRRLYSHGLHPGYHRPALSAIRRHHRDLRHLLRVQRAYPQPRSGGPAPASQERIAWPASPLLRLVQSHVRPRHRRLRRLQCGADPEIRLRPGVSIDCGRGRRVIRHAVTVVVPAGRRSGLPVCSHAASQRRIATAHQ